jgi:conjugal transfer mating pair stabilization protein TraG
MFPIIVVIMVMVSAQGSKQVLGGYMMSLAWIGMWPVLFAVINHLSMMHLRYKMRALELAAGAGIPFQLSDVFDATLTDEAVDDRLHGHPGPFPVGGDHQDGAGRFHVPC